VDNINSNDGDQVFTIQDFSECADTILLEGLAATDYPLMAEYFRKAAEKANNENKTTRAKIFLMYNNYLTKIWCLN
jgi:hypothetical protein